VRQCTPTATPQVVPHITDAIQDWIQRVAHVPVDGRDGVPDVCVIELGGTVGDIESMPFVEALRQFHFKCVLFGGGLGACGVCWRRPGEGGEAAAAELEWTAGGC